ncbi:hypothetical protein CDD82_7413 [Ophiocordyceps australis]|uniref:Uncharacterized protein n=1 Tax=Ophiocordyceps australis TaxID=1399860 RepID=A0A2C5YMH3_9HYPO|nr:hypothetical protein CDD82_7413 [Ophiocordyceps australis]
MRDADFALLERKGTLDYAFELGFLVAQQRPHGRYVESESQSSNGLRKTQWSCPPHQASPVNTIIAQCGAVLQEKEQKVKLIRGTDQDEVMKNWWNTPSVRDSWVVRPSLEAVSRPGCSPGEYEWVGISLRSPLYSQHELKKKDAPAKHAISALRSAIKIHVNSTCLFTVYLQPHGGVFEAQQLKKVAVMAWLLEHDFLISLNGPKPHAHPISRSSALAYEGTPYTSAKLKAEAESWIPRCDIFVEPHLKDIWKCEDSRHLMEMLRGRYGARLAFHIDAYQHVDHDSTGSQAFMVAFQYTSWHPYSRLDDSELFIQFVLGIGHCMDHNKATFCRLVTGYYNAVKSDSIWVHKQGQMYLLKVLGFDVTFADVWTDILEELGIGGELDPSCIDRQPPLVGFE